MGKGWSLHDTYYFMMDDWGVGINIFVIVNLWLVIINSNLGVDELGKWGHCFRREVKQVKDDFG